MKRWINKESNSAVAFSNCFRILHVIEKLNKAVCQIMKIYLVHDFQYIWRSSIDNKIKINLLTTFLLNFNWNIKQNKKKINRWLCNKYQFGKKE